MENNIFKKLNRNEKQNVLCGQIILQQAQSVAHAHKTYSSNHINQWVNSTFYDAIINNIINNFSSLHL